MAIQTQLHRNGGHPWDGRHDFDLLHVEADNPAEITNYVQRAQAKYWATWIAWIGTDGVKPGCLLYKPSGAMAAWSDDPERRHLAPEAASPA